MRSRLGVVFGLLMLVAVVPVAPVEAQSLGEIEVLTRDGRIAQAREALTTWWDDGWADASREQRQQARTEPRIGDVLAERHADAGAPVQAAAGDARAGR